MWELEKAWFWRFLLLYPFPRLALVDGLKGLDAGGAYVSTFPMLGFGWVAWKTCILNQAFSSRSESNNAKVWSKHTSQIKPYQAVQKARMRKLDWSIHLKSSLLKPTEKQKCKSLIEACISNQALSSLHHHVRSGKRITVNGKQLLRLTPKAEHALQAPGYLSFVIIRL